MPDPGLEKRKVSLVTQDFGGGLNTYSPQINLALNANVKSQNCLIDEDLILTRRPGITQVGVNTCVASSRIHDIIAVGQGDERKVYLLYRTAASSTKFNSYDAALTDDAWHPETDMSVDSHDGTMVWGRVGEDADVDAGTERIYIGLAHATGTPQVYTSDIPAASGTIHGTPTAMGDTNADPQVNSRYLANFLGRLWGGGMTSDLRHIVYYSKWRRPDTWDRLVNLVGFDSPSGQGVTGIAPYRHNTVFVGLDCACFLLAVGTAGDQLDWQPHLVSSDIGCGAHKTIANVGEDLFFMDQYGGIRSLTVVAQESSGVAVRSHPISIPIKDETDAADPSEMYRACAAFHNGRYWLSFLSVANGWRLFSYNLATQLWSGPHVLKNAAGVQLQVQGMASVCGDPGTAPFGTKSGHLYFATDDALDQTDSLQVYELDGDVTQDDGATAIDMDLISGSYDFGNKVEDKVVEHIEVVYRQVDSGGHFKIQARTDFGEWTDVGEVDYTSGVEVQYAKFPMAFLGRGRTFQFRFKTSDSNNPPQIIRYHLRLRGYVERDSG